MTPTEQDELRAGVLTDMDVIIRLVHDLVNQARDKSLTAGAHDLGGRS